MCIVKRYWHAVFACAVFVILFSFNITCPIRFLIKIPCPTCGMSRAILSLIRLDFALYARYNAMAIPMIFAISIPLFDKSFGKKLWKSLFLYTVLGVNFVYYLARLFLGVIP